MINLIGAI